MSDDKTKRDGRDRDKVSGSEQYEIDYYKEKHNVSSQDVKDAIKETGSNDRKTLDEYFSKKHKK